MPRVSGHALERSLAQLTVGVVRGQQEAHDAISPSMMTEMLQQVQMPLAGYVAEKPISERMTVTWPYPFVYAPAQRDSSFEFPHASHMLELLTDVPVIVHPAIVGWQQSVEGYVTGANVRLTAWIPGARKKQRFNGILHLTFSGYGAPNDDESDVTEDE